MNRRKQSQQRLVYFFVLVFSAYFVPFEVEASLCILCFYKLLN